MSGGVDEPEQFRKGIVVEVFHGEKGRALLPPERPAENRAD